MAHEGRLYRTSEDEEELSSLLSWRSQERLALKSGRIAGVRLLHESAGAAMAANTNIEERRAG